MAQDIISVTQNRLARFSGRYQEIADRSGLSLSMVSKFANGRRNVRPSLKTITNLTNVLDELEREDLPQGKVANG